jgi:hypothetical protein
MEVTKKYRLGKWRARGDDFGIFPGEFVVPRVQLLYTKRSSFDLRIQADQDVAQSRIFDLRGELVGYSLHIKRL